MNTHSTRAEYLWDTVVRLDGRLSSFVRNCPAVFQLDCTTPYSPPCVPLRIPTMCTTPHPYRVYRSVSPPCIPLHIPTVCTTPHSHHQWMRALKLLLIFISIWCYECFWVLTTCGWAVVSHCFTFVIHNDICCWTSLHMFLLSVRCLFRPFPHFYLDYFVHFYGCVFGVLHISWIQVVHQIVFCNIFSYSVAHLFIY